MTGPDTREPRPVVGVQVLVVDWTSQTILLGRRINAFGSGTWGLPGGHLEFGESFEDAAARELIEETNLAATQLRTFIPVNTAYKDTHYVQIGVEVLRFHGPLNNREPDRCSDLRFFPLTDLPAPLFEPSVPFIQHAIQRTTPLEVEQVVIHMKSVLDVSNRRRFSSIYLIGNGPCRVAVAYGRIGERRPRRIKMHYFEDKDPALQFVRTEVVRRSRHGYELSDSSGNISIDALKSLLPDGARLGFLLNDLQEAHQLELSFDEILESPDSSGE